jgi:hypothetical protein
VSKIKLTTTNGSPLKAPLAQRKKCGEEKEKHSKKKSLEKVGIIFA